LVYSIVAISPLSPKQRKKGHYITLSEEERRVVDNFIVKCGFTVEEVLNESVGSLIRDGINIKSILALEEEVDKRKKSNVPLQRRFFE
jgi:hypothetical protein